MVKPSWPLPVLGLCFAVLGAIGWGAAILLSVPSTEAPPPLDLASALATGDGHPQALGAAMREITERERPLGRRRRWKEIEREPGTAIPKIIQALRECRSDDEREWQTKIRLLGAAATLVGDYPDGSTEVRAAALAELDAAVRIRPGDESAGTARRELASTALSAYLATSPGREEAVAEVNRIIDQNDAGDARDRLEGLLMARFPELSQAPPAPVGPEAEFEPGDSVD